LSCPTSYFTAISFNHIAIAPTTALSACYICWQHWFPTLGVICSSGGYWYPVGVGIRYERLNCESESKKSDDTDHYQHSGRSRSAVVPIIRVGHVDERCRWLCSGNGRWEAEPDSKCTFAAPLMSELSSFATNRMFVSLHLSNQPQSNDRMALVMADLEQT
jgi:hypothetical protein